MPEEKEKYLAEGTVLDRRYEIRRVVKCGGFGIIYEAYNQNSQKRVAIKELFESEYMYRNGEKLVISEEKKHIFENEKEKFLKEARRLSDFSSEPGIVHVLDYFQENNTAYIVMEYIEGIDLECYFRQNKKIKPEDVFRMLFPVMLTLGKVHENKIIHRDISPDNLILTKSTNGEIPVVKLIDFGSARNYVDEKTQTIDLKAGYTPPEQYHNNNPGPWTDVYALCAVMYRGITGKKPVNALVRVENNELQMPSQMGILIDHRLEQILKKGLSVKWENRYQDMAEMAEEVRRILFSEKKKHFIGKEKMFLALSCGICLIVASGFFGWNVYQSNLAYFKFHGEKTEIVQLIPYDDMSTGDYNKAAEIIDQRLNYIAGKDKYILRKKDEELEIEMPLSFFEKANTSLSDGDIEKKIKSCMKLVAQPVNLSVAVVTDEETKGNIRIQELSKEDIVSAKRKKGKIPSKCKISEDKLDQDQKDRIDREHYVEIRISKDAAKKMKDKLYRKYKDKGYMLLVTDAGSTKRMKYLIGTDPEGDWTTYYYMLYKVGDKGWKIFLKTDELSEAFQVRYEIPADWEKNQDENEFWGKNQCKVSDIKEPASYAEYKTSWGLTEDGGTNPGTGAWIEMICDLKEQMDSLNIPYAVGISPDESRNIVIKTAQKDTNSFLQELIQSNGSLSLSTESDIEDFVIYKWDLQIRKKDEKYQIVLSTTDDYKKEEFETWKKEVQKAKVEKVYLMLEGDKIAAADLKDMKSNRIIIEKSCLGENDIFTEKNKPFLDLLSVLYEQNQDLKSYEYYHCAQIQYSSTENRLEETPQIEDKGNMPHRINMENIIKMVKKIRKNADVTEKPRTGEIRNLHIHLNRDLKKSYSAKTVSDIEKIMKEGKEELQKYNQIVFWPGYEETGQAIIIYSDENKGEYHLKFRYGTEYESEEEKIKKLLGKSKILKQYLTEDSLDQNVIWWWYNYDAIE